MTMNLGAECTNSHKLCTSCPIKLIKKFACYRKSHYHLFLAFLAIPQGLLSNLFFFLFFFFFTPFQTSQSQHGRAEQKEEGGGLAQRHHKQWSANN